MVVRYATWGDENHRSRSNTSVSDGEYHDTRSKGRQAVNPNRTTMFHGHVTRVSELPLGTQLHGSPELKEAGLTGRGIKVGVIDSGCDMDHSLFGGMLIKERVYKQEAGGKLDDEPHGTHVAGTINMMAPEAEIIGYRVFGAESVSGGDLHLSGTQTTNEAIAMALDQAVQDGCDIINMSLGTPSADIPIADACKAASRKGVILVVAAGNEGDDDPMTVELSYPAPMKETISVGSFAKKHGLPVAFFSNTNSFNDWIACGWDVTSYKAGSHSEYCRLSGTSMAAPHVTGLIAALLTKGGKHEDCLDKSDPANNDMRVRDMLKKNYTIDVGTPGYDAGSGLGMLTFLSLPQFNARFSKMGYRLKDLAHMDDSGAAPTPTEDDMGKYQRHQRGLRREYRHEYRRTGNSGSGRHRSDGFHQGRAEETPPYMRRVTRTSRRNYSYSRYKGAGNDKYGWGSSSSGNQSGGYSTRRKKYDWN